MIWGFMRYLSHSAESNKMYGITKRAWRWVERSSFRTLRGVKTLIYYYKFRLIFLGYKYYTIIKNSGCVYHLGLYLKAPEKYVEF